MEREGVPRNVSEVEGFFLALFFDKLFTEFRLQHTELK